MHIGLVGGIGPAATDYYYRRIIAAAARRGFALELTLVHADSPILLDNLARDDRAAQVAIFSRLAGRLAAAGAETVAITAIAGHFCIEDFKAVSPLPVIDLIEEVDRAFRGLGLGRGGVRGTRRVMETRFYGGIASRRLIAEAGAEAILLGGTDLVLAFDGREVGFEVVDCAGLHSDAIAERAAL